MVGKDSGVEGGEKKAKASGEYSRWGGGLNLGSKVVNNNTMREQIRECISKTTDN